MTHPQLQLSVLGVPTVSTRSGPIALSPGTSILCSYLALGPRDGRPRRQAATQLFADCTEAVARRRLSTALWRLRREMRSLAGLEVIADATDDRVRLSSSVEVWVDATEFTELAAPVLAGRAEDLTDEQAEQLGRAVALHRGRLVEPCDDDWVLAERTRIETLRLTALDYLLVHHGRLGNLGEVTRYGEQALALEPLREDVHRHLMTAYAAAGRDDLVERQFGRCRQLLLDELGTDPLPETIALYGRLRRGGEVELTPPSLDALISDLERARRDVARLAAIVDRALAHVHCMS